MNACAAAIYFYFITFVAPHGNLLLFSLLIVGEVFHLWQVFTFIYTVWDTNYLPPTNPYRTPPVDVFITVAGEPVDIVRETVRAAKAMHYPFFGVYILNDGFRHQKG
jgi:cellulose synthase (UDP-forming)